MRLTQLHGEPRSTLVAPAHGQTGLVEGGGKISIDGMGAERPAADDGRQDLNRASASSRLAGQRAVSYRALKQV